MNRKFLYTVLIFNRKQIAKRKLALVTEERKRFKVYLILELTEYGEWIKSDKREFANYTSAKNALDNILEKAVL